MVAHEAPRLLSREWFGYWIDLLIFPPLAFGIALYDCRSVTWMVWATTGVLLWTLTEYWTHRTLARHA